MQVELRMCRHLSEFAKVATEKGYKVVYPISEDYVDPEKSIEVNSVVAEKVIGEYHVEIAASCNDSDFIRKLYVAVWKKGSEHHKVCECVYVNEKKPCEILFTEAEAIARKIIDMLEGFSFLFQDHSYHDTVEVKLGKEKYIVTKQFNIAASHKHAYITLEISLLFNGTPSKQTEAIVKTLTDWLKQLDVEEIVKSSKARCTVCKREVPAEEITEEGICKSCLLMVKQIASKVEEGH